VTAIGRAFVAVVPPAEVLDALEAHLESASEASDLRWMRREQLHFTLQFLGRVDDDESLVGALERAVAPHAPFAARLSGAGAFPSARRARVVWVGVAPGADELDALASAVHGATEELGYEREARTFTPHMTVARSSRPRAVGPVVDAIDGGAIGPDWNVTEVVLFESDTRPDGAVHSVWRRIALHGSAAPESDR
jgi:RNA 2',3'-cyclic 3'-phosphodiesterase